MRITIPDALAETIADGATDPQVLEAEVARRLHLTRDIRLGEHYLTLTAAQLDRIGMAHGRTFPPRTADDLCAYAERSASIKLGEIRLDFSAAQLEEIVRLAEREGGDIPRYIGRVVQAVMAGFFRTPAFQDTGLIVTQTITEPEPVPAMATVPTA